MNYLLVALLLLYNLRGALAGLSCTKVAPSNGKVVLKFRGRIAKFSCNPGFVLDGDKVATCIGGRWDAVPRCVFKIQCKQVKEISNGEVMLIRQRTVVKFTCDSGYKLIGSAPTVSCSDYSPDRSKAECIPDVELSCDFEDGLCGWENDLMTGFSWNLRLNATPSHLLKTGPSGDHTTKDGHYLYIETSGISPDEKHEKVARLYSPLFPPVEDSTVCFTFWYHMYGFSIGTLNVYLNNLLEFTQSGDLGNVWRKGVIKNLPSRRFQIVIEATSGNGYAGDIAIDDLAVSNSSDCVQKTLIETTCEGRCFETETNSSLCQCSSDCIVEGSCCADFVTYCSYESSTLLASPTKRESVTKRRDEPTVTTTLVRTTEFFSTSTESPSSKVSSRETLAVRKLASYEASMSTQECDQSTENNLDVSTNGVLENSSRTESSSEYSSTDAAVSSENFNDEDFKSNEDGTSSLVNDATSELTSIEESQSSINDILDVSSARYNWNEQSTSPEHTVHQTAVSESPPSSDVSNISQPSTITLFTTIPLLTTPTTATTVTRQFTKQATIPASTELSSARPPFTRNATQSLPSSASSTTGSPTYRPSSASTHFGPIFATSIPPAFSFTSTTKRTAVDHSTTSTIHISESSHLTTSAISRTHLLTSSKKPIQPLAIVTTVRPTQFIEFSPKFDNYPKNKWASIYKPKGHYTYSAAMKLESGPKTFTYLGVALSLIVLVAFIIFLAVKFVRRRRLLVEDGTEEGDVLFLTSDEALDFSVARRPTCENDQQRC